MTFEKVKKILADKMQISEDRIKPESRLVEDLKADSANVMVLIMEVESEFDITVADDEIMSLKTVQDVVDYIDHAE